MINQDNRDYRRMTVDASAEVRRSGEDGVEICPVGDLSATGLSLWSSKAYDPGVQLEIKISPAKPITPPLIALVEVIRTSPEADGSHQIACKIIEIR
jgi:hypothetical protein